MKEKKADIDILEEKEKKAIEIIKFLQDKCIQENGTGMMSIYRIDDLANAIKILLNLIEKQFKEIEELKRYEEGYKLLNYSLDNYISKDKIEAKIEEIKDKEKKCILFISESNCKNICMENCGCAETIEVLQSLLGKE